MLLVQNDRNEFWDFSGLSYGRIENIYQSVKIDNAPILGIAVLIALVIAMINLTMAALKNADAKDGIPIGAILDLFKEKWKFFLILAFMPVAFSLMESVFGFLDDYYVGSLGEPEANFYDKIGDQLLVIQAKEAKDSSLFSYSIGDFLDYILVIGLQPFIVLIDQWIYSVAIMYKFYFQAILEITGPFAVAFLLNDRTQQKFFAWLKAVIVCYLLIPCFLFANLFVDGIRDAVIVDSLSTDWIFSLIAMFTAIKILLFATSKVILWKVL